MNTRITAGYEYVADNAIVPQHVFSTQRLYSEPGLNILIRQPLPSVFGKGRLEISADLRNLMAQGYLPLAGGDGRQTLLIQAPRAVRGGNLNLHLFRENSSYPDEFLFACATCMWLSELA